MNSDMLHCPDLSQLVQLIESDSEIDGLVANHVDTCADCQRRLDQLTEPAELDFYREQARLRQDITRALDPPIRQGELGSVQGIGILEEIGRGGMGVVLRGWDHKLSRPVAVKFLYRHLSADALMRFRRETQAMAKLEHDNVVPIYSAGETWSGNPFLVMPLVDGISLKQKIQQGPLPPNEASRWIEQVARGLDAAHRVGLIHRDVKPDNILLSEADSRAKLTDFGLARSAEEATLTQTSIVAGTPQYMSPEQIDNPLSIDARSDIYSLGISLYECLTGAPPFSGQPLQILEQHRQTTPIRPSRLAPLIPRDLDNICLMAVAKEPSLRYSSAAQFADDLLRFRNGQAVVARETTVFSHLVFWCQRNRGLASMCLLLLLSLTLGSIGTSFMWYQSSRSAHEAQELAHDLTENRLRLRESISRFQQRVFSEEALHWQMTDSFRAEMFADVLRYLDEFAKLNVDGAADPQIANGLARDYLTIAQSAFDTQQFGDALHAAQRALERLRELDSEHSAEPQSHFLATKLACLASRKLKRNDSAREFALETHQIAGRSLQSNPEEMFWKLAVLEAEFLVLAASHQVSPQELAGLQSLYADLELNPSFQASELIRKARLFKQELGWFLALQLEPKSAVSVIDTNIDVAGRIRDDLRSANAQLAASDFDLATSLVMRAELSMKLDQRETAIEFAQQAQKSFRLGLEQRPQNRHWNSRAARLELQLSDWFYESGNLNAARDTLSDAIKKWLLLSKSDATNWELRAEIIKLFSKLANISAQLGRANDARNEFFIAAQDCRVLLPTDQYRSWVMTVRPWLISQVLEQLELAPNADFQANLMVWEQKFIENTDAQYGTDMSLMRAAVGGAKPVRPVDLEPERITRDLLAPPN